MTVAPVNMSDRIELRRFVGREWLLWLWLETELFDATLETKEHGSFGLWLEGRLVLDEGRESTIIKGSTPGLNREAKESLLRGKMPERAGLHLSFGDHECTLTLRGETLAFSGLVPPKKEKEEETPPLNAPPVRKKSAKKDAAAVDYLANEAFFDRMHFARDVEALTTTLYRDFLTIRLSPTWESHVVPALHAWVAGQEVDAERYRAARNKVVRPKR